MNFLSGIVVDIHNNIYILKTNSSEEPIKLLINFTIILPSHLSACTLFVLQH